MVIMTLPSILLDLEDLFGVGAAEKYQQFICVKCSQLLKDAVQTNCGHFLCDDCVGMIFYIYKGQARCPLKNCQQTLTGEDGTKYFPDHYIRRQIADLPTTCPVNGCHWKGIYGHFESHCDREHTPTDMFEVVPKRKASHVLLNIKGEHDTPQKLRETAQQLKASMDSLLKCAESMERLADGANSDERVSADSLRRSQMNAGEQATPNKSLKRANDLEMFRDARSLTLDAHTATNEIRFETSPEFEQTAAVPQISQQPGQLVVGETHTCHHLPFVSTEQELPPNPNHVSQGGIRQTNIDASASNLEQARSVSPRSRQRKVPRSLDVLDPTTNNPIQVAQPSPTRGFQLPLTENNNYNGTIIWKIPQFSQRMSDAPTSKYASIFSRPFYTETYGYKMCLRLYILGDGIGKNSHMSLFFVVMKGEFDNILKWPFTHKVTFKLINQTGGRDIIDTFQPDPMSSSFRMPKSEMNIASGCPRFVSHTDLKNNGFIADDTVFIKCSVDCSTVRHP